MSSTCLLGYASWYETPIEANMLVDVGDGGTLATPPTHDVGQ
jgi:hypothetical protein